MVRKMTEKEAEQFCNERYTFLDYKDIGGYIEDIVTCLVYSTWHYTEEDSREQCRERSALIKRCYSEKTPAYLCAMDVGYYGG